MRLAVCYLLSHHNRKFVSAWLIAALVVHLSDRTSMQLKH